MNRNLIGQHLQRTWGRHWALQMASVTVMTVVLLILNLLFLSYSVFRETVSQWGQGLEMIVYVHDSSELAKLDQKLRTSGDFDQIDFISKAAATKKFLTALGPDSLELLSDPKWKSPIPASFELRLSEKIPTERRVASLESWAQRLRGLEFVEDVFYGQGWVENFSRFLQSARGVVATIWFLSLCIGLLIVGNCIRLSFLQRRDEIEVLELVGATARFIRMPFILEGVILGALASALSLSLSFVFHEGLLTFLASKLEFWGALRQLAPLQPWYVALNLVSGIGFGALGAWNCVRKLNTGWAAVS